MRNELSIPKLALKIQTESDAYKFLENLLWCNKPTCAHCGVVDAHQYVKPLNGVSRETSRGKQSQRRIWRCVDCKKQFSVTTNTVMHGSHIPIRTWLFVMFEFVSSKNGIAAREIQRKYGVHPKTAWYMAHRIREAMKSDSTIKMIGTIVSDEAWIGGDPKNRHKELRTKDGRMNELVKKTTGKRLSYKKM